jgi:hypothetical protein
MPAGVRSRGRLVVSLTVGVAFTVLWLALLGYAFYWLNSALVGWPQTDKLRVVIIGVAAGLCMLWTVVGVVWVVDDASEALDRYIR